MNETQTDFKNEVVQIFKEIFDNFTGDGKMNWEKMAKFTSKATDGINCGQNDDRIIAVFNDYANE